MKLKKICIIFALCLCLSTSFVSPTLAFQGYQPRFGFVIVEPLIEVAEPLAEFVEEEIVLVVEEVMLSAEEILAGLEESSGTTAFKTGPFWKRIPWKQVKPSIIRSNLGQVAKSLKKGQQFIMRNGDEIFFTGKIVENEAERIYGAYRDYKVRHVFPGIVDDECKPIYIRPEGSPKGYYFYDSDSCMDK